MSLIFPPRGELFLLVTFIISTRFITQVSLLLITRKPRSIIYPNFRPSNPTLWGCHNERPGLVGGVFTTFKKRLCSHLPEKPAPIRRHKSVARAVRFSKGWSCHSSVFPSSTRGQLYGRTSRKDCRIPTVSGPRMTSSYN